MLFTPVWVEGRIKHGSIEGDTKCKLRYSDWKAGPRRREPTNAEAKVVEIDERIVGTCKGVLKREGSNLWLTPLTK